MSAPSIAACQYFVNNLLFNERYQEEPVPKCIGMVNAAYQGHDGRAFILWDWTDIYDALMREVSPMGSLTQEQREEWREAAHEIIKYERSKKLDADTEYLLQFIRTKLIGVSIDELCAHIKLPQKKVEQLLLPLIRLGFVSRGRPVERSKDDNTKKNVKTCYMPTKIK